MTHDGKGCDDYLAWSRRDFLKRSVLGAAAGLAAPGLLPRALAGQARGGKRDVLVYILLRGGLDGLSTVVPYGEAELYAARPNLAVPPPGQIGGAIDLDGFFGLNPAAAPLMPAFSAGRLGFVHAAGSPDPSRSHFSAFTTMEGGLPGASISAISEGWLSRHLLSAAPTGDGLLRCIGLRSVLPLGLYGAPGTLPVEDLAALGFPGDPVTAPLRKAALQSMYGVLPPPLGPAAATGVAATELLSLVDFAGYTPAGGAVYPDTDLGHSLTQCAALIKADLGVEILLLEMDGFDHHETQGPHDGDLAAMLDELSTSLAAFDTDLGLLMDGVVVAAHSEFGRRLEENASLGTDHGHGGLMLLLGGAVNGGQVHGSWPGLAPATLDEGDLAITTDYRDVMGEILTKRMGATNLGAVFPGHVASTPGVIS